MRMFAFSGSRPMATEQICVQYNDLRCAWPAFLYVICHFLLYRNDILLLLDLKAACDACEFELQSLKHRHDVLPSDKQTSIILPGETMRKCNYAYCVVCLQRNDPSNPKEGKNNSSHPSL